MRRRVVGDEDQPAGARDAVGDNRRQRVAGREIGQRARQVARRGPAGRQIGQERPRLAVAETSQPDQRLIRRRVLGAVAAGGLRAAGELAAGEAQRGSQQQRRGRARQRRLPGREVAAEAGVVPLRAGERAPAVAEFASDEHPAVRQQRGGVLGASVDEVGGGEPGSARWVVELGARHWITAVAAAAHQHLAGEQRCRGVLGARDAQARRDDPGALNRVIWIIWVIRDIDLGAGQVADADAAIAADDQHSAAPHPRGAARRRRQAVRHQRRRVVGAGGHRAVGDDAPGVGDRDYRVRRRRSGCRSPTSRRRPAPCWSATVSPCDPNAPGSSSAPAAKRPSPGRRARRRRSRRQGRRLLRPPAPARSRAASPSRWRAASRASPWRPHVGRRGVARRAATVAGRRAPSRRAGGSASRSRPIG